MFAIRVLSPSERGPEGEVLGEITVGDFVERFACYVSGPVEFGWRSQLQGLLDGAPVVALVHDPRFAWVVYRESDLCFVQQRFSLDGHFDGLLPRQTKTEEGERISEWSTTLEAVRQFIQA